MSSMMVTTVITTTNRDITNRNAITPSPASTPTGSEPPIVSIQLDVHVVGSGVTDATYM